jgi:hypothetical protein
MDTDPQTGPIDTVKPKPNKPLLSLVSNTNDAHTNKHANTRQVLQMARRQTTHYEMR